MKDSVKIREDGIKIQEKDLDDTLETISFETKKVSFALAFLSIVVVESLNFISAKPLLYKVVFCGSVLVAIISTVFSLFAKKVDTHTNIDEVFVKKGANDNFSDYIDSKHLSLNYTYKEAQSLLKDKVRYTKITFMFLVLTVTILITGVFI